MRKIIFLLLTLIPLFFIKIPEYNELNKLIIISKIEVVCNNNYYKLTLYELSPKKNNNTVTIKTIKHISKGTNLSKLKNKIEDKTKDKYYYKSVRIIKTNCSNTKEILNLFNLKKRNSLFNFYS